MSLNWAWYLLGVRLRIHFPEVTTIMMKVSALARRWNAGLERGWLLDWTGSSDSNGESLAFLGVGFGMECTYMFKVQIPCISIAAFGS